MTNNVVEYNSLFKEGLLYDPKRHSWTKLTGGTQAIVGLSKLGSQILGRIRHFEARPRGARLLADRPIAVIESDSTIGFIYSPVDCVVIRTNESLISKPELINSSPYELGWVAEIEITNPPDLKKLVGMKEAADWSRREIGDGFARGRSILAPPEAKKGCCG